MKLRATRVSFFLFFLFRYSRNLSSEEMFRRTCCGKRGSDVNWSVERSCKKQSSILGAFARALVESRGIRAVERLNCGETEINSVRAFYYNSLGTLLIREGLYCFSFHRIEISNARPTCKSRGTTLHFLSRTHTTSGGKYQIIVLNQLEIVVPRFREFESYKIRLQNNKHFTINSQVLPGYRQIE